MAEVRAQGYATSNEESEDGVSSVAVALHTRHGGVGLAITASVPQSRMADAARVDVARHVASAVEEINELLV